MTWRVQGVTNGWLDVFLCKMCCHKASSAVVRLVAFQRSVCPKAHMERKEEKRRLAVTSLIIC